MQRQEILERAGWQFFRILYSHYINDKHQATAQLWDVLRKHSIPVARLNRFHNLLLYMQVLLCDLY
jgi:2-keto-3-deoxy-L-rhamnonate aldolase RhmA